MKDHQSHLKARYCRAVLRTAARTTDDEARKLFSSLATELPTAETSPHIQGAEIEAIRLLVSLSKKVEHHSVASGAADWKLAYDAVEHWIAAAEREVGWPAHAASSADGGSFSPVASS